MQGSGRPLPPTVRRRSVGLVEPPPLPSEVLEPLRSAFGKIVSEEMRYGWDRAQDLGRHLQVTREGNDVRMRFDWCGDEMWISSVEDMTAMSDLVEDFARHIADDLKEHRGRYGEALPWDS